MNRPVNTSSWFKHLNVSLQTISHAISHKWNYAPGCTAQGCCTHKHDGKYIRDIYLHQSSFVSHFLPHTYTDLDNTIHPGMNCHKRYANQITISHGYQYNGAHYASPRHLLRKVCFYLPILPLNLDGMGRTGRADKYKYVDNDVSRYSILENISTYLKIFII